MTVFVALDNHNGMMLNNRRQSRDSMMLQKMFEMIGNDKLFVHSFSQKLLTNDYGDKIVVRDDFLKAAQTGDNCFVENQHIFEHINKINTIYVFRWNRDYLSDFKFDIDLSGWEMELVEEFAGYSHDCITLEKYTKTN